MEQHETFPNVFEALLLVGVLIIIQMVVGAAVIESDLLGDVNFGDLAGVVTVMGNGVLFVGLMAYKQIGYRTLFHPARTSAISTMSVVTVPILLLVPGLMIFAGTINSIVIWLFPMSPDEQAMFAEMMAPGFIPVLFACVAAPLLEEMLFRGVILRSFLRQYSRTKAILCSSLVFGIAHLNVYQLASAFAIGIVAGWLYERCRSLWPCILLHAAYNAFVTASYIRAVEGEIINSTSYTAIAFVAAIAAGLFLLRVLHGAAQRADATITKRD
ncbi:hypothetical protein HNQ60_002564 [Povalibacter uvarum]|uniref:CAAX prenyl protease 2/Lysostaphin resistance protein A-like domain-containing protein n=1 Tax=Povalibacter uvarum TaxID=732238 RepID=A0A841HLQ7_9GAMM|nr:type II CAAX endopeptidase family protein [Povalibacter uvarum]MBB6093683.1 hypothetical protein [Povalibacter uvarum]